ncbi:hypothetical protein L210DRAFT_3641050 [Boletus edulis BED1]|uniref:Uncharacterized protein n=1 Tax=Boletus edulis BED1 TaxID=1328754 RepID=A0AAD4C6G0_BOLED|nr:hypothetical protein L210DRAFT_3641050 [Boletus edulis BED1]
MSLPRKSFPSRILQNPPTRHSANVPVLQELPSPSRLLQDPQVSLASVLLSSLASLSSASAPVLQAFPSRILQNPPTQCSANTPVPVGQPKTQYASRSCKMITCNISTLPPNALLLNALPSHILQDPPTRCSADVPAPQELPSRLLQDPRDSIARWPLVTSHLQGSPFNIRNYSIFTHFEARPPAIEEKSSRKRLLLSIPMVNISRLVCRDIYPGKGIYPAVPKSTTYRSDFNFNFLILDCSWAFLGLGDQWDNYCLVLDNPDVPCGLAGLGDLLYLVRWTTVLGSSEWGLDMMRFGLYYHVEYLM